MLRASIAPILIAFLRLAPVPARAASRKTGPELFLRAVMANGSELNVKKTIRAVQDAGGKIVYAMARDDWYGVYYISVPARGRGDVVLALFGNGAGRLIEDIPVEDENAPTPLPSQLMDPTYRPPPRKLSLPAFPMSLYVKFDPVRAAPEAVRRKIQGACLKHAIPEQGRYWVLALKEEAFAASLGAMYGLEDVRLIDPVPLPEDLAVLSAGIAPSTSTAEDAPTLPDCPRPPDAAADPLEGIVPPSLKDPPRTGFVVYSDAASNETVGVAATLGQVLVTFKNSVEPQAADLLFRKHGGMILEKPFDAGAYRAFVPAGKEGAFIESILLEPSVAKALPEVLKQPKRP